MRILRILVLLGAVLGVGMSRLAAQDEAEPDNPKEDTITVIASGSGADENEALKQALSNAITEAIGTFVDDKTVVKNDHIISDQVLTASDAIIDHYDPVGTPSVANGLTTVKIQAQVKRRELEERLSAANIQMRQVEGGSIVANVREQILSGNTLVPILHHAFSEFPCNLMKADAVGDPKVVSKGDVDATISVTVRICVDKGKYDRWYADLADAVSSISTVDHLQWNPASAGVPAGVGQLFERDPHNSVWLSQTDERSMLSLLDAKDGVARIPWRDRSSEPTLAVFARPGASRVLLFNLDGSNSDLMDEVRRAATMIPYLEIDLRDENGQQIDGREEVGVFAWNPQDGTNYFILSPFFEHFANGRLNAVLPVAAAQANWSPQWSVLASPHFWIFPYIPDARQNGSNVAWAVSGLSREFQFNIPLDKLIHLKSVTVKFSSRRPGE